MLNVLLGKTLKAMYKLSGKTLNQLSEESDLTLDTINNLFYARIQKPGLAGVCALTRAMGFRSQDLVTFLEENADLPDEADVTEKLTNFLYAEQNSKPSAQDTKQIVSAAKHQPIDLQKEQYETRISLMRENQEKSDARYEHELAELKETYLHAEARTDEELKHSRRSGRIQSLIIGLETMFLFVLLLFDALNPQIGWLR